MYFICLQNRKVRSNLKWCLDTHVETHVSARCELTGLKLFTPDWVIWVDVKTRSEFPPQLSF